MKEIFGTHSRVLDVDLSTRSWDIIEISEDKRKLYLGGKGLGLWLLYERLQPGIDPLGDQNIIAFMMGVLMGTGAPCSGRFDAITKSPLTGIMTTCSCGGPFGMQLKTAGYDGLLIRGTSETPAYLEIDSEGAIFKDANDVWGLTGPEAQAKLVSKKSAALVIGPGGENLVRYANVMSGHRFLGRGGIGAVMGAKRLKAVVARGGTYKILPKNKTLFDKSREKARKFIKRNPTTSVYYRNYGTPGYMEKLGKAGVIPVRNFTYGTDPDVQKISGQGMQKEHDTSDHTCKPCLIRCGKKGSFSGKTLSVPEYETVTILGSNLGIFDTVAIAGWNDLCSQLGIDTISTGGTLAWVMEASEKGLVESPLKFGSTEGVAEAIEDIARCRGFGAEMAMGTKWLAKKYGGKEFAMHVKGLELPGYDPRGSFGMGLCYAVANRGGCHLSAYLVAFEVFFNLMSPSQKLGKPTFAKFMEDVACIINSLHICQFTQYAFMLEPPLVKYTPQPLLYSAMQYLAPVASQITDVSLFADLWSSVTGIEMSPSELKKCGERIHTLERYMNTREGISRKDDTLPPRLLNEARKDDPKGLTVPLESMLDGYYKLRGFDSNGIPPEALLKKLGIKN